ncbi:unnamed protein product [Protopolystoma xenopodis]|uniref:Secreted protein n=1 Tax=Protopolystoma xenopodis TaxID=117903 RepID=A0A3S5B232_9PLAT|nr:unnamed protein product [Protopolystoma xenopodis]
MMLHWIAASVGIVPCTVAQDQLAFPENNVSAAFVLHKNRNRLVFTKNFLSLNVKQKSCVLSSNWKESGV